MNNNQALVANIDILTTYNGYRLEDYALCGCECGHRCNSVGATFRPGHDARLVSKLLQLVLSGEYTIDEAVKHAVTDALANKLRNAHHRKTTKPTKKTNPTTRTTRTTGTIRVGRWEYPTHTEADGSIFRNMKRDGTGTWVAVVA